MALVSCDTQRCVTQSLMTGGCMGVECTDTVWFFEPQHDTTKQDIQSWPWNCTQQQPWNGQSMHPVTGPEQSGNEPSDTMSNGPGITTFCHSHSLLAMALCTPNFRNPDHICCAALQEQASLCVWSLKLEWSFVEMSIVKVRHGGLLIFILQLVLSHGQA